MCNSTGNIQADTSGTSVVRDSDRHPAANAKASARLAANGHGDQRTIQTPATAPAPISSTNCSRVTFHTRFGAIHMPMARAAISGKITSRSPVRSATPTISTTTAIADR